MYPILPSRSSVDTLTLHTWTDLEIHDLLEAKNAFTAYQVTLNLRKNTPDVDIPHDVVRERVHFLMGGPAQDTQFAQATGIPSWWMELRMQSDGAFATEYWYDDRTLTVTQKIINTAAIFTVPPPKALPGFVTIDWEEDDTNV